MQKTNKVVSKAFFDSSPIFFAYFPLGLVFGLVFENQGYSWILGPIMSLFVYAGAVQFSTLSFLDQGSPLFEILMAAFFIAIRNAFYGPAFFDRFARFSFLARTYLTFSLVDATYGILLKPSPVYENDDQKYCLYLSGFIHFYWVVGTIVGIAAGAAIPEIKGLEFVLTILFGILAIDQYYKTRKLWPFLIGAIGWFAMHFFSPKYSLLGGILFSAAVFSFAFRPKKDKTYE